MPETRRLASMILVAEPAQIPGTSITFEGRDSACPVAALNSQRGSACSVLYCPLGAF